MDLRGIGWDGMNWINLAWGKEQYECGNEPSGSVKYCESLDWLINWRLLKKESTPWN
jgi:hypothetical protein